jgi:ribosome-associated protein
MANPFIEKEVTKIIASKEFEFPTNVAMAASCILANLKALNLKVFDARESSSLCDFNVLASATNTTQAKALVDELLVNLKNHGLTVLSMEGLTDGEWILVDFGDIIIHIFQETSREIFDLDSLWIGQPQLKIPEEYYYGVSATEAKIPDTTENYF